MFLLAQLNFNEIPPLPGFPTKGILQFFIDNDDVYGMDFEKPVEEVICSPQGYRVIYHGEIITNLSDLEHELSEVNSDSLLPLANEYALKFVLKDDLPSPSDYRFEKTGVNLSDCIDDIENYIYDDFMAAGSKLGGYAYFTQYDPR